MKRLVAAALACLVTAALIPGVAVAGKPKQQKVAGSIAVAAPYTDDTCFFGLHRRARLLSASAFPNGILGFDFPVQPSTAGKPFKVVVTGGDGVDLDVSFYDGLGSVEDPAGAPANADYATRKEGGEKGKVPPVFDTVIICMYAGNNASFTYTAGKGVK